MKNLHLISALVAMSGLVVGCTGEPSPEQATNIDQPMIVHHEGSLPFPALPGARPMALSAQVWLDPALTGSSNIVIGAEGHRIAIERVQNELDALYQRADVKPSVIEQQEAYLAVLVDAARQISTRPAAPQAVTCSVVPMIAPSSSLGFRIGIFAGHQAVCSGGCQAITTTPSACTDLVGCSPPFTVTDVICDVPQLGGIVLPGSPGAQCAGIANINPPNVTVAASIPCG